MKIVVLLWGILVGGASLLNMLTSDVSRVQWSYWYLLFGMFALLLWRELDEGK